MKESKIEKKENNDSISTRNEELRMNPWAIQNLSVQGNNGE